MDTLHDQNESRSRQELTADAMKTLALLREELIADRRGNHHWEGTLSASALSTATAISAIAAVLRDPPAPSRALTPSPDDLKALVRGGIAFLEHQQNEDGGFGDTDRSHSNVATSYLVLAASRLAGSVEGEHATLSSPVLQRLERYIRAEGELEGLKRRYGKDKTFVVPIMTNLAIAGVLRWDQVPALPFEAAVFPQSMYRFLRMPVVSYAVPALVAMGQARFLLGSKPWAPLRQIRSLSIARTMNVLQRMQPESGGYLEATPLTAFVLMSLAATGRSDVVVAQRSLKFLVDSVDADGAWPIDTNLATWVTSLSILALTKDREAAPDWCSQETIRWHLGCQHIKRHPFTGADPGGWGWTDLSGAVPDGDDTPGAMLALDRLRAMSGDELRPQIRSAVEAGTDWLLGLQNRDGGWPTFCRGWGKLPFDRSSTDLTAHAIRALRVWTDVKQASSVSAADQKVPNAPSENAAKTKAQLQVERAIKRGKQYLRRTQRKDGSWNPLWFGNQDDPNEENPVYGTSRVLLATAPELDAEPTRRALEYLLFHQNEDGGWGGGASVTRYHRQMGGHGNPPDESTGVNSVVSTLEESAVAVEALAEVWLAIDGNTEFRIRLGFRSGTESLQRAIIAGVRFLIDQVDSGMHHHPWPIGFYFAKLWYYERLYPLVFATAALGAFHNVTRTSTWSGDPPGSLCDDPTKLVHRPVH